MLFYHTFTPPQDISVRVNLTFTGLGETLSLPVGWRGSVVSHKHTLSVMRDSYFLSFFTGKLKIAALARQLHTKISIYNKTITVINTLFERSE